MNAGTATNAIVSVQRAGSPSRASSPPSGSDSVDPP